MNQLTKSLLEDLLDIQKTVAIFGGGFKPPTKGHFDVVKLALDRYPEIDELKIFVGGGIRDGITQEESIKIWDIYKKYLSPKVDVEPSIAPVKSILGYAKENPDTKVYWILGAREEEEGDLLDIKNRTKTISKYPNLEVKILSNKGGISGTKTRNAIKNNNKEQFFQLIPDIPEKQQIWDLVSPVVKEETINEVGEGNITPYPTSVMNEDEYEKEIKFISDSGLDYRIHITNSMNYLIVNFLIEGKDDVEETNKGELFKIMSTVVNEIKKYIDKHPNTKGIIYAPADKNSKLTKTIDNQRNNLYKAFINKIIPGVEYTNRGASVIAKFPEKENLQEKETINEVGEANLKPYKWEEVDINGWVTYTEFTTESETEYKVNLTTTTYGSGSDNIKALEVEFSAKPKGAEGSSTNIVVNKGELYRVMATITAIIKYYVKKFKAEAIMYSPSKKYDEEDFGLQRDNLYKAFITKAIPGIEFKQNGGFIIAILPNTIKETVTATEVICDNCGWEWPIADGGEDLYICHKCGHDNNPDLEEASDPQAGTALPYGSGFAPVKENDPFGLNELAQQFLKETLKETWKPKESFVSLCQYMIDNGMNIQPLPKIKVINNDVKNASNLLGKTAYYNPTDKSITLYTMDRHPKDVLRSFSHEMIHHQQNLEGRLNNITTTNTREDGDLPEIEREAYEKGNMMLRGWEDSIKNS